MVGAGAAGLAAARRLRERGLPFVVLEARDRTGGRAYTLETAGAPVDLGAEFIHGKPRVTLELLREYREETVATQTQSFQLRGGRLEPGIDVWDAAERIFASVDLTARDRSVKEVLNRLEPGAFSAEEVAGTAALIEGFDAADVDDASAIAIAKEWRGPSVESSLRPANGYAALVKPLTRAAGEAIVLRARVDRIEWSREGVRLCGERDGAPFRIESRCAIVTLPIGVLRERNVTFNPELPETKRRAIAGIAMGAVVKVVYEFRRAFWESVDAGRYRDAGFFLAEGFTPATVWTQYPKRTRLLTAWTGGGAVKRLLQTGTDPVEAGLETCGALFPSVNVRAELQNAYYHDWQADPFACGAYSYVRVSGAHARADLAAPLENVLFFAGEAASADDSGTVAGAIETGYSCADEIAKYVTTSQAL